MNQTGPTVDFSHALLQRLAITENDISLTRKEDPGNFKKRYELLFSYFIDLAQYMTKEEYDMFKRGFSTLIPLALSRIMTNKQLFTSRYDELEIVLRCWKEENKQKMVRR